MDCEHRLGGAPVITQAMVHDAAEKKLPHPDIGTAPVGAATLVNIETVLWVATSAQRDLGTVTLLGQTVSLRAHVQAVAWRFGDGHVGSTSGPEKAYSKADPCTTPQCRTYFGHTYVTTGRPTITATITWTGQFRIGGGTWQAIAGTVTAPAADHTLAVKEARSVLVGNPGGR